MHGGTSVPTSGTIVHSSGLQHPYFSGLHVKEPIDTFATQLRRSTVYTRRSIAGTKTTVAVTEHLHNRMETFLAGQNLILEKIACGADLPEVLASLLRLIESQSGGMLCSILLLDEDGLHLRHGAAPSLPKSYIK